MSRFLPIEVLEQFYFTIIFPSVCYALIIRGRCANFDLFQSLERIRSRAVNIIFNLPKNMPSIEAINHAGWPTLFFN